MKNEDIRLNKMLLQTATNTSLWRGVALIRFNGEWANYRLPKALGRHNWQFSRPSTSSSRFLRICDCSTLRLSRAKIFEISRAKTDPYLSIPRAQRPADLRRLGVWNRGPPSILGRLEQLVKCVRIWPAVSLAS
jgi:hypothetical protein